MISKTTSIKRPALLVFGLLCASCGSSGKSGADGGADVSDTSGDTKLSDILPDSGHGDLGLHDLGRGDSSGPDANDTQLADLASDLATGPDTLDVQDDTSGITGQEETTLKVLFPTADRFEQVVDGDGRHFEAFQGETSLGLAFQAGAYGFNSEVICMTAITPVGITVALEVVSQYESWWFQVQWDTAFFDQFKNLTVETLDAEQESWVNADNSIGKIDAVTGATYSSQAVISDFWQAIRQYKKLIQAVGPTTP